MSEVEKTPDTEVNDEEKHQEEVVNEDATEKDATSSEHSTKAKDPKGNVLDVFKQFASSTGPSWADMMIEEAATVETEKHKQRLDQINKEINHLKEPFIVYVSKLSMHVTAEDIYYFFGGNESVCDVYRPNEGKTGDALVELKNTDSLRDALMKSETDFFKEKVKVEYVDACSSRCFPIPQPKSSQSTASQYQDRGPQYNRNTNRDSKYRNDRDRNDRGGDRRGQHRYNQDNNRPRQQQHYQQQSSNDVRASNKSYHQIQPHHHQIQSHHPIPPLMGNNGSMNQQHVTKPPPRVEQAKPVEQSKPAERRGPKVNPFGEAKPVDKTNEVMRQTEEKLLAKQLAEQQLSEKKSEKESKKKSVQKKTSISSQQSQHTIDDQQSIVEEQHKPEPIAENTAKSIDATVEPEKKSYSSGNIVPPKRKPHQQQQHSRSEYGHHQRGNQKINTQPIQKLLERSQKSNLKDERSKQRTTDSDFPTKHEGHDRKYQKRRTDRKDFSATTHSNAPKEALKKQSSAEKSPPIPAPLSTISDEPAPASNPSESVDNTAVSTPTTNEPSTPTPTDNSATPSSAKSKKSKSSKKKKNSTVGSGNNMFSGLNEVRD